MKSIGFLSLLSVGSMLSACGYVPVQPQARQVLILPRGRTSDCKYMGKTQVSVSTKFRLSGAVESDLRNVAKNETATLGGDTATPLDEPTQGKQTFGIYKCVQASNRGKGRKNSHGKRQKGVQVHPYHPPLQD